MQYLGNEYKYYIDWCGSLFWVEIFDEGEEKLSSIKDYVVKIEGYLTVIKNSNNSLLTKDVFTIDKTRLSISKKIKESFDPKGIFNPGKMYRGV